MTAAPYLRSVRQRGAPEVIIRPMLTVDRAIDLFLGDLTRRGATERTRRTYARLLDKFGDRLPDDYDVSKITTDDCRRWLDTFSGRARGGLTIGGPASFFGSERWYEINIGGTRARPPDHSDRRWDTACGWPKCDRRSTRRWRNPGRHRAAASDERFHLARRNLGGSPRGR